MDNDITIVVTGTNGVGKTTIAKIIEDYLRSQGLSVIRTNYETDNPNLNWDRFLDDCIAKGRKIYIRETLPNRSLTEK